MYNNNNNMRLTESDLKYIVKESVKRIVESSYYADSSYDEVYSESGNALFNIDHIYGYDKELYETLSEIPQFENGMPVDATVTVWQNVEEYWHDTKEGPAQGYSLEKGGYVIGVDMSLTDETKRIINNENIINKLNNVFSKIEGENIDSTMDETFIEFNGDEWYNFLSQYLEY